MQGTKPKGLLIRGEYATPELQPGIDFKQNNTAGYLDKVKQVMAIIQVF